MANLKGDDRGQLILVAGFALAASFVALALVLNSVIFTENLATRSASAQGSEAIGFRNDVVDGTEELIEVANANESDRGVITNKLNRSLRALENRTAEQQVTDGQLVSVELMSTTPGFRIGQNSTTGNFTNTSVRSAGAPIAFDWVVVSDVTDARSFRINLTDDRDLEASGVHSTPLTLVIQDQSTLDTWEVRMWETASGTEFEIYENGALQDTCTGSSNATLSITGETVDGTECEELRFRDHIQNDYRIEFLNGFRANGTYTMVLRDTAAGPSAPFSVSDPTRNLQRLDATGGEPYVDGEPFVTQALYSATVNVRYESTELVYETDARAVPGETDD